MTQLPDKHHARPGEPIRCEGEVNRQTGERGASCELAAVHHVTINDVAYWFCSRHWYYASAGYYPEDPQAQRAKD